MHWFLEAYILETTDGEAERLMNALINIARGRGIEVVATFREATEAELP